MANINQIQLPDGSSYNLKDSVSSYATETYVDDAVAAIDKTSVGLGNVDNTSDANKPVSTAQQTALNGKTNTSVIAYTESSATATKRYEIGDQFILSGVLYTATAIIANGGTITVGTNCTESDTIVEQISIASARQSQFGKTIMITDSFGEPTPPNIITLVPQYLGIESSDFIGVAAPGCGFSSSTPRNYLTELQSITVSNPNEIKTIIITGGSNDTGYGDSESNILNGISAFMTYVKATFPNANVYLAFTGWTLVYSSANWNPTHFTEVLNVWAKCIQYGAFFLHNVNAVMHVHSNYQGDDVHPTSAAQYDLARAIANSLKTGSAEVHYKITPTISPFNVSVATLDGNWSVEEKVDNEIVTSSMIGTGTSPSPRLIFGTNISVDGTAEPPIIWVLVLNDYCIGNTKQFSKSYIGLFTCNELTTYAPIEIIRQANNIGIRLSLPAGTYTTPVVYLPSLLVIETSIYS